MATGYNQTPEDLYEKYKASSNVGISYTGLIYNLDVGYGTTNLYNPGKNRFIELSPNFDNKTFTISTPGAGVSLSNGIGTSTLSFGSLDPESYVAAAIPGIGTGTPSKLTVEMWVKNDDVRAGGMFYSFGIYDVWSRDNGRLGFNQFDATNKGITDSKVLDLMLEGNWHHYVFVMTPYVSTTDILVENKIYIDSYDQGTLLGGTGGREGGTGFSNGNMRINGVDFLGWYKLYMDVGAVRVYNRELTSEEVTQNYDATKSRYYPEEIVSDGLVLNLDATNSSSVGVGTTWTDLSGNGNNGTLFGNTHHSDGPFLDAGFVEFDGTGDYLKLASSADFGYGTGDFTWEFWINFGDEPSGNYYILDHGSDGGTVSYNNNILRYFNTTVGASSVLYTTGFGSNFTPNTWYHFAAVRNSGTTSLYANGLLVSSASDSHNYSAQTLSIATYGGTTSGSSSYDFTGYISNLRILKGTALYTSNFTPPSRLLTAVDNTVLLTCQKETIRDGSIGIHTVTPNGNAAANLGFPSSAYNLDGTDDYVDLGQIDLQRDFTLEGWFYHNNISSSRSFFGQGIKSGSQGLHIQTTTNGDKIRFGMYSNDKDFDVSLSTGVWHHYVFTYDDSSSVKRAYRDGVELSGSDVSGPGTYSGTGVLRVGQGYSPSVGTDSPFDGRVSEVRTYTRVLTAAEVLQNYNATKRNFAQSILTSGLLLNLDAGDYDSYPRSGTTWTDLSGQGNDGTLTNGPTFNTVPPLSIEFDGTDDYVDLGTISTSNALQMNNPSGGGLTIQWWGYFDDTGNSFQRIFDKSNGGAAAGGWAIYSEATGSGNSRVKLASNGVTDTSASTSYLTSAWQNWCVTWEKSSGTYVVYLNGVQDATGTRTYDIPSVETTARIGNWNTSTGERQYNGKISEIQIYDQVLTSQEVLYNYNVDKARFGY